MFVTVLNTDLEIGGFIILLGIVHIKLKERLRLLEIPNFCIVHLFFCFYSVFKNNFVVSQNLLRLLLVWVI